MSNRLLLTVFVVATAMTAAAPASEKLPHALQIVSRCAPGMPWTVAGEHGALLGRQNGRFEAWQWPVKLLSDFRIRAELQDYAVPIDVNALAAEIKVTPAETTITYSHAAFTVRQHMFASRGNSSPAVAMAAVFEIESARRLELTFSFTPDMLHMWPAPNHGRPGGEWVARGASGFYVLHTDDPKFSGIVAMPNTRPGIQVPYQEHPQTYPLELKLSFDPKKDRGTVYPLAMGLAQGDQPSAQVTEALAAIPQLQKETEHYYAHFFETRTVASTPDEKLNDALLWAELAIDQTQVKYHDEVGLVAGYYESADSARPGYAWFFGRDTLWTTYAINSYGDFALTRRALNFLLTRQREDGKIMHEYSQSADALDWKQTPYFYASADSTPLLVMAMWDYVRTSGDTEFLKANWGAVKKAYEFTRAHTGNDGIYSNSEGTGWVESWPQGMPREEVYLAAIDGQSATAMSRLAAVMGDSQLSGDAHSKASEIASKVSSEFYSAPDKFYAFSRNPDGSLDRTASIYSSVAWWDGTLALDKAGPMLSRWASPEFSADWGTRDISEQTPFYDPISYHQGSIWPLFTGWVSLAEYRAGRPLSGYAHLMQNTDLTWAQDLGSVTELLSGQFFQPLGRSSSHQMWSSAMIITPLLRGLFGLDWNALNHTLQVRPHLPADWNGAALHNVKLGDAVFEIQYSRAGGRVTVEVKSKDPAVFCVVTESAADKPCTEGTRGTQAVSIVADPVEISMPSDLPSPGEETEQLKAIEQQIGEHEAAFTFAGQGGSSYDLKLRLNRGGVTAEGAAISAGKLHLAFPNGTGYQTKTIRFHY